MKSMKFLGLMAAVIISGEAFAQSNSNTVSGKAAVQPIPDHDKMYSKTVWRTLDLREKQNKPLFAEGRQITKIIIDAVKRGELPVYKNDLLTSTLTLAEFNQNMTMVDNGLTLNRIEQEIAAQDNEDWGPEVADQINPEPVSNEYFAKDLYQLEIKEEAIFDKKRSRMYYDIKALTLIVPATLKANERGRDILVGTFKYSDLVKVFRNHSAEALWINPQNDSQHKNLADAFDLRLFSSFITKVSNPDNSSLEDLYGGRNTLIASQQVADKMVEYEYNLWSF